MLVRSVWLLSEVTAIMWQRLITGIESCNADVSPK